MQEFSSISVSSYDAGALAERLTEQSKDGWAVVSIVPTGSTITAYLSRDGAASDATAADTASGHDAAGDSGTGETAAADDASDESAGYESDGATDVPATPDPVSETPGWAAGGDTATESASTHPMPEAASTPSTPAAPATPDAAAAAATPAAGAAPAGWYADPSSRFELRYWDGGQWTEHVSRAGQQYTDPPVA